MSNVNLVYTADKKVKLNLYQQNLFSQFISMDLKDSIPISIDTIIKILESREDYPELFEVVSNVEYFSQSTLLKLKAFKKTYLNEISNFIEHFNAPEKGFLKLTFCLRDEEESYITIHFQNNRKENILYTRNVSKEFSLEENQQTFVLGFLYMATAMKIHEEGAL